MSPQELINQLGALNRRGALDAPEIKSLVEAKLAEAKTADRVSALKAGQAIEAAGVSADIRKQLEKRGRRADQGQGPHHARRRRCWSTSRRRCTKRSSWASGSARSYRPFARAICTSTPSTRWPTRSRPRGKALADWERAFHGIMAGGATSCGVALKYLERKKQFVEQIVMITDEQQNTPPLFVDACGNIVLHCGRSRRWCIVRTPGGSDFVEKQCRQEGIPVDVFQLQRRLLFAAEPGADAGPAIAIGAADGDHGLSLAAAAAGVEPLRYHVAEFVRIPGITRDGANPNSHEFGYGASR